MEKGAEIKRKRSIDQREENWKSKNAEVISGEIENKLSNETKKRK